MAGNSKRKGAMRKPGSKKGAVVGSGGQRRKGLEGKGPTPKAHERPNHKAYRKPAGPAARQRGDAKRRDTGATSELIAGQRDHFVGC